MKVKQAGDSSEQSVGRYEQIYDAGVVLNKQHALQKIRKKKQIDNLR